MRHIYACVCPLRFLFTLFCFFFSPLLLLAVLGSSVIGQQIESNKYLIVSFFFAVVVVIPARALVFPIVVAAPPLNYVIRIYLLATCKEMHRRARQKGEACKGR